MPTPGGVEAGGNGSVCTWMHGSLAGRRGQAEVDYGMVGHQVGSWLAERICTYEGLRVGSTHVACPALQSARAAVQGAFFSVRAAYNVCVWGGGASKDVSMVWGMRWSDGPSGGGLSPFFRVLFFARCNSILNMCQRVTGHAAGSSMRTADSCVLHPAVTNWKCPLGWRKRHIPSVPYIHNSTHRGQHGAGRSVRVLACFPLLEHRTRCLNTAPACRSALAWPRQLSPAST